MMKNPKLQSHFCAVKNIYYKQILSACITFGCLVIALWPNYSTAQESPPRTIKVEESETQLAKWFAAREAGESPFEYSLGAGLRQDALRWSIADAGANVASEVQWKSMFITQLRGAAKLNLPKDWQVRGSISAGAVKSGGNQDSDFADSNRTQEFSRSNNSGGGSVRDFSIAAGKKFRRPDFANGDTLFFVPLVGLSIHQQNFTMFNGVQTIPANGPFAGLGNSYDTKWQGVWAGLEAVRGMGEKLTLTAKGELHVADYSAQANWNLRNDLAHPTSFEHSATGLGLVMGVGGTYRYNKNFLLNGAFDFQIRKTGSGTDRTFFAGGTTANYTLNPVRWNSTSLNFGAAYQF
jgi:Protochlamydia outer membrane protein